MSSYKPVIEFDYLYFMHYVGRTFKSIHQEMEEMRKAVKNGLNYTWDNSHSRINNIYGKPALTVLFSEDEITFWNFNTDDGLVTLRGIDGKLTQANVDEIQAMIEFVSSGKRRCNDCGEWVETGESYSYAGFVCEKCFNPKRHQAPDSMEFWTKVRKEDPEAFDEAYNSFLKG